jgi:hypothetical protein
MSSGKSKTGSSASSLNSESKDSAKSSQPDYVSQLLNNVVQYSGYKNLTRFVGREGKAFLSLQKVVNMLSN